MGPVWALFSFFPGQNSCVSGDRVIWPSVHLQLNGAAAPFLPPVVGKSFVGFGHAVDVFLLLNGGAATVGGIQQLVRELVNHAFFAATAAVGDQPADSERGAPVGIHFDRD